jgi:hypothetical protein
MSRRSRRQTRLETPVSFVPPPWPGGPCLELVHEFNERFISEMAQAAREVDASTLPEMVRIYRDLWVTLDRPACQRASRCPFLLADIHFRDEIWWERAQSDDSWQSAPAVSVRLFPRKLAAELTRDALTVAWYTVRQDARLAAALFAMSEGVARVVAKVGLRQLRLIPDHHHQHLRPRWDHLSSFWGRLLSAARRDDIEALHDLHLHAFQLADSDSGFRVSAPESDPGIRDR